MVTLRQNLIETIDLTDLNDVTIVGGAQYNLLQRNGAGEWVNIVDLNLGSGDITTLGNITGATFKTGAFTLTIDETVSLTDYMQDLVDDASPQLGGDLDGQSTYDLINMVDGAFSGNLTVGGYITGAWDIFQDFDTTLTYSSGLVATVATTDGASTKTLTLTRNSDNQISAIACVIT